MTDFRDISTDRGLGHNATEADVSRAANGPPRSHLEGLTGRIAEALVEADESTDIDPYDMRDPNDTIGGRL